MLFIKRRVNETILIGEDIEVQLLLLDSDQALIGIDAPRDIAIYRKEVYERRRGVMYKLNQGNR